MALELERLDLRLRRRWLHGSAEGCVSGASRGRTCGCAPRRTRPRANGTSKRTRRHKAREHGHGGHVQCAEDKLAHRADDKCPAACGKGGTRARRGRDCLQNRYDEHGKGRTSQKAPDRRHCQGLRAQAHQRSAGNASKAGNQGHRVESDGGQAPLGHVAPISSGSRSHARNARPHAVPAPLAHAGVIVLGGIQRTRIAHTHTFATPLAHAGIVILWGIRRVSSPI